MGGKYNYVHYTDEETKAQRDSIICPKSLLVRWWCCSLNPANLLLKPLSFWGKADILNKDSIFFSLYAVR